MSSPVSAILYYPFAYKYQLICIPLNEKPPVYLPGNKRQKGGYTSKKFSNLYRIITIKLRF